ncbi:MAG: hypothetical protein IPM36_16415 [Lewinellaceae bacterium]|nr:hypothetical protein [Lewinellaceae bacterium]
MENSRLAQLLQRLSPVERRKFERFLQSPYFNTRSDVLQLFNAIRASLESNAALPERDAVFQAAFPEQSFSAGEQHLLMTYLARLFEQFIRIEQIKFSPELEDWLGVKAMQRLGLENESARAIKKAIQRLESGQLRSVGYHEQAYRLLYEHVRQRRSQPEKSASHLQQLSQRLNTTLAVMCLRQASFVLSEKAVYNMEPDTWFLPEVFRWVETDDHVSMPAVGAYYFACKMLLTGAENWFKALKTNLSEHSAAFPPEELYDLHMMSINYCVRKLNAGDEHYFQEIHELYKVGLETKTLLHNGALSPLSYYNIVISGLKVNALDWVAWFIPQYKNSLERRFRDSAYSFNMARLHYARREYGEALVLLQKANYRDLLTNLAAKTQMLKIYFEQGELEVLRSHLDAMSHFLRRKRVIGYHRENYLNIIRAAKRLLALPPQKSPEREQLRQFILSTDPLTERKWFLEVLER